MGDSNTGLGKVATVFACGAALFSDGYVNAVSGAANTLISAWIKQMSPAPEQFNDYSKLFSSLVFAGTVVGMLVFGVLSDRIGRKFGMLFASVWLALWAFMSGLAWGANGSIKGLQQALVAYRFLQGIAIGAEYPAGSVAASENTEDPGVKKGTQNRLFVLATNTMIDIGFVLAYFVPYLLLCIFGTDHLEWVWRVSLGFGGLLPLFVLFFRVKMREPERYRKAGLQHDIPWALVLKRYWPKLLAISLTWWIYDWVTYPAGIYSNVIIDTVIPNATLYQTLGWSCLINTFYLPGTIIGAFITDKVGPRNCMVIGLLCQAIIGFILTGTYNLTTKPSSHIGAFIVLYGLFLSFGEVGPGNNLGLLAAKAAGPTMVRGHFYGAAAAVGKIGAFVGSYVYQPIQNDLGPSSSTIHTTGPFWIASALAILSAAVTFFFIPNPTQDYMQEEDERFIQYLVENGWDASHLGVKDALDLDNEKSVDVPSHDEGKAAAAVETTVQPHEN